jgi:hypothetical protein
MTDPHDQVATPRTDAAQWGYSQSLTDKNEWLMEELVSAAFARQLERELLAAQSRLETVRSALDGLSNLYSYAWDREDGALVMYDFDTFELRHQAAVEALALIAPPADKGEE